MHEEFEGPAKSNFLKFSGNAINVNMHTQLVKINKIEGKIVNIFLSIN